jgi:short-subunit dehydrogenase
MELKDKTILLTGATGGIGSVLLAELEKLGAKVIPVSKSLGFDLTKKEDIEKLIDKIKKEYGQVDILINAHGIGIYKNLNDLIKKNGIFISLNLTAPFILIKELMPKSLVFTIGTGAGVIPMRGRSGYCASKFGLRGLMLSLAEEYKDKDPKFCLITLGSTLTNFGPMTLEQKIEKHKNGDAYFTPEWVADKLVEIIKDDKRENEIVLYPGDFGFGTWKKP